MLAVCTLMIACGFCSELEPGNRPVPSASQAEHCESEPTAKPDWFQPGDLILFRTDRISTPLLYSLFLSGTITHSAIVVRLPDGQLALLESPGLRYPVMLSDVASRLGGYKGIMWVRRLHRPLTPRQCAGLTQFALAQEGKRFVRLAILLPPIGRPTRKLGIRCAGPVALDARRWFCSSLTVAAGVAADLLDPCAVRPQFTDPEDLFSDRLLDLSHAWAPPSRLHRCDPTQEGWWSRSKSGERYYWE